MIRCVCVVSVCVDFHDEDNGNSCADNWYWWDYLLLKQALNDYWDMWLSILGFEVIRVSKLALLTSNHILYAITNLTTLIRDKCYARMKLRWKCVYATFPAIYLILVNVFDYAQWSYYIALYVGFGFSEELLEASWYFEFMNDDSGS